jgi:hypothetical protein
MPSRAISALIASALAATLLIAAPQSALAFCPPSSSLCSPNSLVTFSTPEGAAMIADIPLAATAPATNAASGIGLGGLGRMVTGGIGLLGWLAGDAIIEESGAQNLAGRGAVVA